MRTRRLTLTTLAWLCAAAGVFALMGTSAQALVTHHYLSQFNEVPANLGGPLSLGGSSMTVDSGHLWVAEPSRVDEFDASTGAFLSQLVHSEGSVSYSESGIAVGHTAGEGRVYVGETGASPEAAVAVFDEAGALKATWTGAATPEGSFGSSVTDVAVDNSTNPLDEDKGYVYVVAPQRKAIYVFRPEADGAEHYVGQIDGASPSEPFEFPFKVAVNDVNGDLVVEDAGTQAFDTLEPQALGAYILVGRITATPSGPLRNTFNLAIDGADGEIYLTEGFQPVVVDQFSSTGAYLGRFTGADTPGGDIRDVYSLAVDPESHHAYIGDTRGNGEHPSAVEVYGPDVVLPDVETGLVASLKPTSATLTGAVNPASAGQATCRFDWGTSTAFGEIAACEPEEVANGASPIPVHAALSGLQPDTTYHYRLQAQNANGTNTGEPLQDQEFTTSGPGIREESTSDVASTSATLDAKLDPHGTPASYYFQYSTTSTAGCATSPASCISLPSAPGLNIGSGEGDVEVDLHIQGLLAGTVYHYRVVVISELSPGIFEAFDSEDRTLTTQPVGSELALPDGRQWEMVSSPDKLGADIEPIGEGGVVQASVNGNAITYLTSSPTEAEAQGYSNADIQVLSGLAPSGWVSQDRGIPHPTATGAAIGVGYEYRFFSEDLSLSVVQPFGASFDPSLSPEASEQTPLLSTDYLNGNAGELCVTRTTHCYRPLVTGASGYANVPAGTVFGACPKIGGGLAICGPEMVDATPDLSHIILRSTVALTTGGEAGFYEWAGGKLTPIPTGVGVPAERHGISDDGSRVILTGDLSQGNHELAMRDVAKAETVQLDAAEGGTERGGGEYQTASADGSVVFFTDERRLTAGSHREGHDLYECKMVEVANKLTCSLSDLTSAGAASGPADVQGVVGASEDGSYVYFVANGVLAGGAMSGTCGTAATELSGTACGLYVRHDGATKLVATLSGAESNDWSTTLPRQTARVSPDGRWLTFMSQEDLTGYVTSDAVTGRPDEEVYLYDANSAALVCASCDPTGARPAGVPYAEIDEGLTGGGRVWGEQGIAANIPGWTSYQLGGAHYQSRFLSDSGRLFFNSSDALVPQDVNGAEDVYEYEPPGVGNCEPTSTTYSERSHGCVDLISSGTSGEESGFLDASGTGGDVFFLTSAKLSTQDRDTALDIYDAHECTGASPCLAQPAATPPPCTTGDACKAAPSPQPAIFGAPSSATFSGAGNVASGSGSGSGARSVKAKGLTRAQKLARALRSCHSKHRRRAICERQARARYAGSQSGKATNARKRGSKG